MWFEDDDSQMTVRVSITAHDKEYSMSSKYEDDALWPEVLSDIIKVIEASYGYTFNIEDLGMYYSGKDSNE
jgi:hypothetical protein